MERSRSSSFAEVLIDRLIMESFPQEKSLYYWPQLDEKKRAELERLRSKLKWHVDHSLSKRQKEVLKLYLLGKKQGEIGAILGVRQQVVNIYKRRAINRLRQLLYAISVC